MLFAFVPFEQKRLGTRRYHSQGVVGWRVCHSSFHCRSLWQPRRIFIHWKVLGRGGGGFLSTRFHDRECSKSNRKIESKKKPFLRWWGRREGSWYMTSCEARASLHTFLCNLWPSEFLRTHDCRKKNKIRRFPEKLIYRSAVKLPWRNHVKRYAHAILASLIIFIFFFRSLNLFIELMRKWSLSLSFSTVSTIMKKSIPKEI